MTREWDGDTDFVVNTKVFDKISNYPRKYRKDLRQNRRSSFLSEKDESTRCSVSMDFIRATTLKIEIVTWQLVRMLCENTVKTHLT